MAEKLSQEAINTAIKDPEHLTKWLQKSGRKFIIFNALDLVKSLRWPEEDQSLVQIISSYRNYRRTILSGEKEKQKISDQVTGQTIETDVELFKDETLTKAEMKEVIEYLNNSISE